jgi:hypothetical protein
MHSAPMAMVPPTIVMAAASPPTVVVAPSVPMSPAMTVAASDLDYRVVRAGSIRAAIGIADADSVEANARALLIALQHSDQFVSRLKISLAQTMPEPPNPPAT